MRSAARTATLASALVPLACIGLRGELATGHAEVEELDRASHPSPAPARIEYLGDGCYVADGHRLYECTLDALPVGQRLCMEDWGATCVVPEAGTCFSYVELDGIAGRRVDPTGRCRGLFRRRYPAPLHPPIACGPSRVTMVGAPAWVYPLPTPVMLPDDVLIEVARSGKTRLIAGLEVCVDLSGTVSAGELVRSSGFVAIDRAIAGEVDALASDAVRPATRTCTRVTIVVEIRC